MTALARDFARRYGALLGAFLLPLAAATAQTDLPAGAAEPAVSFSEQVYPIFERRCHACHGPGQQLGGLRLDSKAVALAGGVSGPGILPGNADGSPLLQRVAGLGGLTPMPLGGERLPSEEVSLIRAWIVQGAHWPEGVGVDEHTLTRHWAYIPPTRPEPPAVREGETVRNPVDSFVLARLERAGLSFAPEASKEALARRVSLDLRGLPPSIDEVDEFLADSRPDAYERLVDRLLKSPHFGEHFGAYWLDLARYADTNGYESDEPRTMWAYRDWVIDAFNRNLPFDRFTIEQLAGDLLEGATVEQIVATGFHRNTMLNNEAGSKNDEFYDAAVKDRVDTTATVWLGSTVGCAQCHDHKYDPFRQDEYYRLYDIFNDTADSAIKISAELEVFKGDRDALRRLADRVESAKAALEAPSPVVEDAQRRWEARTKPELAAWDAAWHALAPVAAQAVGGADLEVLADGSVLAGRPKDGPQVYEVRFESGLSGLTGLRLEALRHEDLPDGGPGWGDGGAFALTGVEAEAWDRQSHAAQAAVLDGGPAWGSWHAIGPFRVGSRTEAFETEFPPEADVDLNATYENGHLAWLERKDWADGRVHYLGYIPDDAEANCASYVFRSVEVREPVSLAVSLGSLKGLKVWLNSNPQFSTDPTREIAPDQERLTLDLPAGRSEILLKLTNDQGPYGFYFQPYLAGQAEARVGFGGATGEGGGWAAEELSSLLDGRPETGWSADSASLKAAAPAAVLRLERPLAEKGGQLMKVRLIHDSPDGPGAALGRFRILGTTLPAARLAALQSTPAEVRRVLATASPDRTEADSRRLAAHFRGIAPELAGERARLARAEEEWEEFRGRHTTKTLVMQELPEPRETRIQNRGSFLDLADRVEPGVPSALTAGRPPRVSNRLELATWLASPGNPLTARVRVNQIWNRIFGRGLVSTAEDFGTQGERPSHPGLLDWLATEFVRQGWDTHALLRIILTSRAYRQDSAVTPARAAADPDNAMLSRGVRGRIAAESVRDVALASSGLLSQAIGGPSVFPPQPSEVFGDHFIEGGFKRWPTSEGADRYRRGLYTFYKRTAVYPAFMNFDAPDRTVCTVDRSVSNTPLQALNTLNDPAFLEAAGSLARSMLLEGGAGSADRVIHGFRSVLTRRPSPAELERLLAFHGRMAAEFGADPGRAAQLVAAAFAAGGSDAGEPADAAPWVMVANVLLNLDGTYIKE